jgi:hypothetical protein
MCDDWLPTYRTTPNRCTAVYEGKLAVESTQNPENGINTVLVKMYICNVLNLIYNFIILINGNINYPFVILCSFFENIFPRLLIFFMEGGCFCFVWFCLFVCLFFASFVTSNIRHFSVNINGYLYLFDLRQPIQ